MPNKKKIEVLESALRNMIDRRYEFAEALAGPFRRGETERFIEEITTTQAAIDTIRIAIRETDTR